MMFFKLTCAFVKVESSFSSFGKQSTGFNKIGFLPEKC
jgi:hypothetical protein